MSWHCLAVGVAPASAYAWCHPTSPSPSTWPLCSVAGRHPPHGRHQNNARMPRREPRWRGIACSKVRSGAGAGAIQRGGVAAAAVRGATCAAPGRSRPSPSPRINKCPDAAVDDPAMAGTPSCAAHMHAPKPQPCCQCSSGQSRGLLLQYPARGNEPMYDDELVTPARLVALFSSEKISDFGKYYLIMD